MLTENRGSNVKVSQGRIPDAIESLNNRIDVLEKFSCNIADLLIMPTPVKDSCGTEDAPVPAYTPLEEQIREADNRISQVTNRLETIQGVLSDQFGQDLKLV